MFDKWFVFTRKEKILIFICLLPIYIIDKLIALGKTKIW